MAENKQCKTHNQDILGMCSRLKRFIEEALKCQSANAAHVISYDLERLKSYLSACRNYRNWVSGQPQLDLPELHPRDYFLDCASDETIDAVENESIKDWCRMFEAAWYELVNSQSSRMASGFISHDLRRFDHVIDKMEKFLSEYVEKTLPLDLPESIPAQAGVTSGRTGI
jgi:hypothetical protein